MIRVSEVPQDSLLGRYAASGAYTDCYVTELPASVTHAQFVEAFYTTALFKLERLLLGVLLSRPSTDAQAKQLAEGQLSSFAAWSVESRAENQLVLATGRTRSWLMVTAGSSALPTSTRLFFGSAVVPPGSSTGARSSMGLVFTALLVFHKLYSRALLLSARARLSSQIEGVADSHRGEV
jgi:Trk-type K+ transport system membrane component